MLAVVVGMVLVSACTSRQVYENIRQSRLQECDRLPVWRQADCRRRYDTRYYDYEKDRKGG